MRAARVPDVPTDALTSIDGDHVLVTWQVPYDGGSVLTAYEI